MKVLYFFSSGFDTPNPSYHLMEAMIEDTLEAGIDIHMISSHMSGINDDVPKKLREYNTLSYDIVKYKVADKSAFLMRYLNGVKYAFDCRKYIRDAVDYDVIYVQSCPTALYNVLIAKYYAKDKPVIYSIQDMFPGSSIHSGVMNKKWMQNIFYRLQKIAYRKADYINVISKDMKNKVIEQGISADKIHVVVDWCDTSIVREVKWESNRFVKKYNLSKEKFYVQYAGTMGYVFDYKIILEVAKLIKSYPAIELQMIGQGSQKEQFINKCKENNLTNIVFYPLEPLHMVSDVYSASSVGLIPLKKGIIGNSVPSKAAQLMACGRTIINSVDIDSEYFKMFNDNNIGISVSNEKPKEIADAIIYMYKNENKRLEMASNAKKFGQKYYSRQINTQKLINQLKNITDMKNQK